MSMTLEQAFDALNDTTVRLQNVAAECSNDDMADAMREKARVHARAVATVKANLTQPAQSVDVDAINRVIDSIDLRAESRLDVQCKGWAEVLTRAIGNAQAEGWRLVPIEPNESMRAAALTTDMPSIGEPPLYEKIWRRMLDAAPTQATPNAHE